MFDIGFWELLVIGVVLLLVMGPERLPEVAKQAAFFVRKARQGMFRLRSEMRNEMECSGFAESGLADLESAKREMTDLKNNLKQFGRDLADSAEEQVGAGSESIAPKVDADKTSNADVPDTRIAGTNEEPARKS